MSKKGGYCLSLLKEAFSTKEDYSAGERVWMGVIGLVGGVVHDPVKAVMNALDVDDSNPAPDPDDPSNPCNQNF